jgi:hypothetical protein
VSRTGRNARHSLRSRARATLADRGVRRRFGTHLPHSGSVFPQLKDELKGYSTSPGALRFDIDHALHAPLVEKLIAVRVQQAFPE